jgi:predicted  nucleic acid-binding Zn-ribbon protein
MPVEALSVQVGANIDDLLKQMKLAGKSLQDFKDQAARFKSALSTATDPASVIRLNKAIDAANAKIRAIQGAGVSTGKGLEGLSNSSNRAGESLTNLGRIAQDAPFGFIGIQNNINPLLESFQRLKVETGSTGGALKALAGSLTGAAGIGLAVSVVTGLLTVLSQQGFFKTEKAADKAAESLKTFKDSLKDTEASALSTGIKLQSFIDIAKNGDLPQKQRNEALEEANKILGQYGEKLTLANIATAAITEQTKKFTEATVQQALAAKFADRAADLIIQQRDASKVYGAELKKLNEERDRFNKSFTSNAGASEAAAARLQQSARSLQDQEKAVAGAANNYKAITGDVKEISAQLNAAQLASTNLFGELGERSKAKKAKKDVETVKDVLAELQREISFLNQIELTFGTNEAPAKIKEIESTVKKLVKDFKVDPQDTIVQKLLTGGKFFNIVQGLNIPGIQGLTDQVFKTIETEFNSGTVPTITIPLNIQTAIQGLNEGQQGEIQKFLTDATSEVEGALEGLFENIGTTIGNTLGRALAGSASIGDLFKGIFNQLGASMQELGKFFIQTGIQIKLIKAFLIKNPALAIAGGIALVALGSLIQAKTNVPGFATGGTAPGGSILVGERGPEIITAPRGATITPNAQTNAILNGGNSGGTVVFKIQGRELVGILNNTNASLSRSGQN